MGALNTLFLRIEGPLQSWGDSKLVIRRTMEAPTKSGIFGLICCAEHQSRQAAQAHLKTLNEKLKMGVRIDRPGERWWDYHTVGAKVGVLRADGTDIKWTSSTNEIETLITRREYLCDASFLVALQGEPDIIAQLIEAMQAPKWTLYLGRKCCPPSRPLLEKHATGEFHSLISALKSVPWRPRLEDENPPPFLDCLSDWEPTPNEPEAPDHALVWYDVPRTFDPPSHDARFVIRKQLAVGTDNGVEVGGPTQSRTPAPERIRTDYGTQTWGKIRDRRISKDWGLCVFCKAPASTGQHTSYRRAGREDNLAALADETIMQEHLKNVRALCRLCHDAVTMIEYGLGMGLDRINPEELRWRDAIIRKRGEIIEFRSLEMRRRRLSAEEVE